MRRLHGAGLVSFAHGRGAQGPRGLVLVLLVAGAALVYRLGVPSWGSERTSHYVFDEAYTVFTARALAAGHLEWFGPATRRIAYLAGGAEGLTPGGRVEWSHPPGAPLAMAAAILAFGVSAVTVRAVSVAAALVTLVATGSLAGRRSAAVAGALLVLDPQFFVLARTAMPQMLLTALVSVSALLTRRACRAEVFSASAWAASGAAWGLACAVRWTALPIALAVLAVTLATGRRPRDRALAVLSLTAVAFALAYLATFIPYLAAGHDLADLLRLHQAMLWFHTHVPAHHGDSSPWYLWPFQLRPTSFDDRTTADGRALVLCGGFRLLGWWLLPAVLLEARRRRRRFPPTSAIALAVIAATWLPWSVFGRFGLSYDLLPALPFVAVLAARRLTRHHRSLCFAPVGLALLMFLVTYPVLTGLPLTPRVYDRYAAVLRSRVCSFAWCAFPTS